VSKGGFSHPHKGRLEGGLGAGERLICPEAEVDGIGIAVVPPATDAAIALHLMVARHLHLGTHKLLSLAQVRHTVLAEEMGGIDED